MFLGLSCGEQDKIYGEEIVDHAKAIDFFWRDVVSKDKFQDKCNLKNYSANKLY